ncbi:MAG: transglycosylase SLT domain-containing protein [bacterium]
MKKRLYAFATIILSLSFSTIGISSFEGCNFPATANSILSSGSSNSSPFQLCVAPTKSPSSRLTNGTILPFTNLIRNVSDRYGMDWLLVMAMMKQESQFDSSAISEKGASGLMQIMPSTQAEIASQLGLDSLQGSNDNIKAGIFHLRTLLDAFPNADAENRVKLALASYNAGLNRILDAQALAEYLGQNPNDWMSVSAALQLLSKRYKSLHQRVWAEGRPNAGYFGDWRQPQEYVDKVFRNYENYQAMAGIIPSLNSRQV